MEKFDARKLSTDAQQELREIAIRLKKSGIMIQFWFFMAHFLHTVFQLSNVTTFLLHFQYSMINKLISQFKKNLLNYIKENIVKYDTLYFFRK